MKVELVTVTPNAEERIVEIARVSSKRKDKKSKPEGLINYLIKHSHWSPFEHAFMTLEIETSKAIGIQLIRHRSFTFQEFSQRYQDVGILDSTFEEVELRKQAEDNRQSSEEVFDPKLDAFEFGGINMKMHATNSIAGHLAKSKKLYTRLLENGVSRETARMILPMCTKTKIYMSGPVRSWIHFFALRDDSHAQKEIQQVAKAGKKIFKETFPLVARA